MKNLIISKLIQNFKKFKKIILRMKILLINSVCLKIKRMQIYMMMMNLKIFKEIQFNRKILDNILVFIAYFLTVDS